MSRSPWLSPSNTTVPQLKQGLCIDRWLNPARAAFEQTHLEPSRFAIASDTPGCDIARMNAAFGHAAALNDGGEDVELAH
jgi:hypothetical protein